MEVCIVGATGAFGRKHLEAIDQIEDVTVAALVSPEADKLEALLQEYDNPPVGLTDLTDALALDNIDAIILATPTHMHAAQAIQCLEAGKNVLIEIPMADNIPGGFKGNAYRLTPSYL